MENINVKDLKIIKILTFLIIASVINSKIFELSIILTLIYDALLLVILYFHFFQQNKELYGSLKEKISLVLLSEVVIISFQPFYYKEEWGFLDYLKYYLKKFINPSTKKEKVVDISPNMLTIIVSIGYSLSLKFRYQIPISILPKDLCLNVLNILFFSSLLSVLFSNNYFYIPFLGETSYTEQSCCIILLVFFFVGMKSINLFIFPVIAILSLGRIGEVNKAMKNVGIFYLLLAYISISLQLYENELVKRLINKSIHEIKKDFYFNEDNNDNNNNENLYQRVNLIEY